ncbi:MAG: SDR family NAD(P)-dependent oxidoreductase [Actinobacteria bacterium]|nr:MAG: SDR family NAD(P)-dependent oxidoreductase [Actinomycetota bacterium]
MEGFDRRISGERVVVTGATSGIGRAIARDLARRGARLTLLARDEARAAAIAAELAAVPGSAGTPDLVSCDLADLGSVRHAARELHGRYDAIDVLINNAGMRSFSPGTTVDGFELMMGTNHLGPFLLTNLLLDSLTASQRARVVTTASEAHRLGGRVDLAHLAEPVFSGPAGAERRYGQSKLMNILFTQELALRLAETTVTANCFCPGAVATGLVRETRALDLSARLLSRTPLLRTPQQGARMGVRLVVDPSLAETTGRFFTSTPGLGRLGPVSARTDRAYQREAWERSSALVGLGHV